MTISSLPFASLENELLRVDYLTTTGPRITGLYLKGVKGNLLAETPDIHWPTPHGEYYLRGGHRLWTAPEDPFYTCPEDRITVISEDGVVSLTSEIDPSGLEKEISFHLHENCVELTHRVTWHGKEPIKLAPWAITQLRLGSMAVLPLSNSGGLAPNRNIVLWPYSQVKDDRLELYDDLILLHGQPNKQAFKIGTYNEQGWTAAVLGDTLFVKRYDLDPSQASADKGCNAEAYVRDSCLELESLGPLTELHPAASVVHNESWDVRQGEYPPTLETARTIMKQLSMKPNLNGESYGKQN